MLPSGDDGGGVDENEALWCDRGGSDPHRRQAQYLRATAFAKVDCARALSLYLCL